MAQGNFAGASRPSWTRGNPPHFQKLGDNVQHQEMNSALPASLSSSEQSCEVICPTSTKGGKKSRLSNLTKIARLSALGQNFWGYLQFDQASLLGTRNATTWGKS